MPLVSSSSSTSSLSFCPTCSPAPLLVDCLSVCPTSCPICPLPNAATPNPPAARGLASPRLFLGGCSGSGTGCLDVGSCIFKSEVFRFSGVDGSCRYGGGSCGDAGGNCNGANGLSCFVACGPAPNSSRGRGIAFSAGFV